MNNFSHSLKSYLNIIILIFIFLIGAMITYLNLSYSFNLSISSKNKKAIFAEESLNRFPEGLKLISMKNLNELTKNDISKIQRWLDEKVKKLVQLMDVNLLLDYATNIGKLEKEKQKDNAQKEQTKNSAVSDSKTVVDIDSVGSVRTESDPEGEAGDKDTTNLEEKEKTLSSVEFSRLT